MVSKSTERIGREVASGAAEFGRLTAVFSAIGMTLIGLILIIIGIWLLRYKDTHTKTAQALVTSSHCTKMSDGNPQADGQPVYICYMGVTYKVGSQTCTTTVSSDGQNQHQKGETVTIRYDPEHVCDAELAMKTVSKKLVGVVMIGISVLLMFFSWFWVYITRKSKFGAAATGAGEAMHLLF